MFARDDASERISKLNKQATAYKADNDLDAAIACLVEAKGLIYRTAVSFPVQTWLRLPMFLQAADRMDEAIVEFRWLANETVRRVKRACPQATATAREGGVHAELAAIYNQQAIACKRAKRTDESVQYAGLAAKHRDEHDRLFKIGQDEAAKRCADRQKERAARRSS